MHGNGLGYSPGPLISNNRSRTENIKGETQ
jgi:hypothetical protein